MSVERYLSERVMRLEQARLWPRVWQFAGLASDLPNVGDYFVHEVGAESIVVVRTPEGLRAHHNVCRHRGHPLCQTPRGTVERFACPFHGWRYALDGSLESVPARETFPQLASLGDVRLVEVAVGELSGLVFVRIAKSGPSLEEFLGPMAAVLSAYGLDEYALVGDQTVEAPCNWKVALEANNEGYHIPVLHAGLGERFDDQVILIELVGDHAISSAPSGSARTDAEAHLPLGGMLRGLLAESGVDEGRFRGSPNDARAEVVRALRARADLDVSALEDAKLADYHHYAVFPNLGLNLSASTLILQRHRPHANDPGVSYFDQLVFTRVPRGTPRPPRATHESFRHGEGSLGPVTDEDMGAAVAVQRGLASSGFPGPIFGERERLITHLLAGIDRYLDAPSDAPADGAAVRAPGGSESR